jgi:prolyl-tRNA editing enzyme YbaK/EbsC (Cys-tRNA(Pro) deacylase)
MPVLKSLLNLLDNSKVKYEVLEHRTVYTAMDKARTLHLEPKMVVKTAVVKFDRNYGLAFIPADKNLDKNKLKAAVNQWRKKRKEKAVKKLDFAKEAWMKKNLSGKVGATPPFGQLFKLATFVDNSLLRPAPKNFGAGLRQPKLIVNAGDYNFSLKLAGTGFEKAIGEVIKGSFSKTK